jgi:hypothetical protein
MQKPEALAKLRDLLTSVDDVAFFFGELTSPEWIPLLEEAGLLKDPPSPVESEGGAMFPFWPVSRYLVRVADQDPERVADVLYGVRETPNPRIWWDTVDGLVKMPAAATARFVPTIKRWVHHPWRLGLDVSTAKLIEHLVAEEARDNAIELGTDLARLVPPAGWDEAQSWIPLDNYEYGKLVARTARRLATFGPDGIFPLVGDLEEFLRVRRPEVHQGRRADLSFMWRPAIEDHEQNWDHDREAELVRAIRDGLETLVAMSPEALEATAASLLDSQWPVVRRLGLHLLVEYGDRIPGLAERSLTDRDLLDDDHHRHELYRLVSARFGAISPEAKRMFVENVKSVATADGEAAAKRREIDPELIRDIEVQRWLSPVADYLDDTDRTELDAIAQRLGGAESHPDFPSYHSSWMGSTSPLSSTELRERSADDLLDFLASWTEPDRFGPGPGVDGLAHQLTEAVAEDPAHFGPLAPRFVDLEPAYVGALLHGLQKALEEDKSIPWEPVLTASLQALHKPAGPDEDASAYHTWNDVRISIARLLQRGLEDRPGAIPLEASDGVWSLLALLAEDREPTPEHEARYGPPNTDAVTYSLNTTRSAAFDSIFRFLLWQHRHHGDEPGWTFAERLPELAAVLDAHLDPHHDPSVAVRATYGWWLPSMLWIDRAWTAERAPRIVGRVTTLLERAAWDAFLFRGEGRVVEHEVLRAAYASFAEELATLDAKPGNRPIPGDVVERLIDHLVLPWLHRTEMRDELPLRTLVASGKAWLVAEVVEEAGRLIGRTPAADITAAIVAGYRDLWAFIIEASSTLDAEAAKTALAPFAWWFDSDLPGDWTLPELLALMERGILPDPAFPVVGRLPGFVAQHPAETLRVVEILAGGKDEDWTLRTQEAEIRTVLAGSIHAADPMQRERAAALVHRMVRLGLAGLASLLREREG